MSGDYAACTAEEVEPSHGSLAVGSGAQSLATGSPQRSAAVTINEPSPAPSLLPRGWGGPSEE